MLALHLDSNPPGPLVSILVRLAGAVRSWRASTTYRDGGRRCSGKVPGICSSFPGVADYRGGRSYVAGDPPGHSLD